MNEGGVMELKVPPFASMFSTVEEVDAPKSIMLYGMPGTRKTTIASSIAKVAGFKKVLHIDIDNGTEVLANDPIIKARIEDGSYNILPIDSLAPDAFAKVNSVIDSVCQNNYGYDAVILDTLDVAQDVAEKHYKALYANSSKDGKKDGYAIWGDLGEWTDEKVRAMHNAKHFVAIFTVHAKEQTSESGKYRILPKLSGSSKDGIAGVPSMVAYLSWEDVGGNNRLLATVGESTIHVTKNRFMLADHIGDLDMPKLYSLISKPTGTVAPTKEETK